MLAQNSANTTLLKCLDDSQLLSTAAHKLSQNVLGMFQQHDFQQADIPAFHLLPLGF